MHLGARRLNHLHTLVNREFEVYPAGFHEPWEIVSHGHRDAERRGRPADIDMEEASWGGASGPVVFGETPYPAVT